MFISSYESIFFYVVKGCAYRGCSLRQVRAKGAKFKIGSSFIEHAFAVLQTSEVTFAKRLSLIP